MLKTIVIFIIALLGFGMIRLPLQNHILEQEKAEGLLDNPVELPLPIIWNNNLPWSPWEGSAPWWRPC